MEGDWLTEEVKRFELASGELEVKVGLMWGLGDPEGDFEVAEGVVVGGDARCGECGLGFEEGERVMVVEERGENERSAWHWKCVPGEVKHLRGVIQRRMRRE